MVSPYNGNGTTPPGRHEMTFKHQTESYRTKNGKRFVCEGDVLDTNAGDLREQAQTMVKGFRAAGRAAFFEKHDGGNYYRVFAEVPTA
jgi:hypothetical protein